MSLAPATEIAPRVRIAVATGSGERVDQHFSRSPTFDIFDIVDSVPVFVERRENREASCGCQSNHDGAAFSTIIEGIADCSFVVAQRIGNGALSSLIDHGIRASQSDDTVSGALQTIIASGKLKNLLRRQKRQD
jgi:predicted Fe-Mo cluster-binding NifX family protein